MINMTDTAQELDTPTVAIVGAGVVGRGWIPVFAGAGFRVRVFDPVASQRRVAAAWVEQFLAAAPASTAVLPIDYCESLECALAGVDYVQESVQESVEAKRALFRQLDRLCDAAVVLASSTSSLDINEIAADCDHPERCFTAHPFNPAAVLPVVEVMGTAAATPALLERTLTLLRRAGQMPVVLNRFVPGYIGNRLQAALMREALSLVDSGVADPDAIDALLTHGLALRWVILGVFGTNHTNADHGLREYYARFWDSYRGLISTLAVEPPDLDAAKIAAISDMVEKRFGNASVADIARWRDDVVRELRHVLATTPLGTAAALAQPTS